MAISIFAKAQTAIPNGDFENWTSHGGYSDPDSWDSDNEEAKSVPIFGKAVVTRDSDHASGDYSAKLTTKSIAFFPFNVPGILTLGNLSFDIPAGTYSLTGGVPIHDVPIHLQGFYKYLPNGGDSCLIAIGLSRWTHGVRDSLAYGYFSTKLWNESWTPFSAYIQYDTTAIPDTFNILIVSSVVASPTADTQLYVDKLTLDYSLGIDAEDPSAGIKIYQDKEARQMLIFLDFQAPQQTSVRLYNLMGQVVSQINPGRIKNERIAIDYGSFSAGCYVLEIVHENRKFCKKLIK